MQSKIELLERFPSIVLLDRSGHRQRFDAGQRGPVRCAHARLLSDVHGCNMVDCHTSAARLAVHIHSGLQTRDDELASVIVFAKV